MVSHYHHWTAHVKLVGREYLVPCGVPAIVHHEEMMSCSSHGHRVIPETVRPSSSPPDTYIMRSCVPAIHCEWEPHETWCSIHSIPLWAPHVFQFQQPWSQWTDCPGVFQPSTSTPVWWTSSCTPAISTVWPAGVLDTPRLWDLLLFQPSYTAERCPASRPPPYRISVTWHVQIQEQAMRSSAQAMHCCGC